VIVYIEGVRVSIYNSERLNSPSIESIAQSRLGIRAKRLGTADAPVSRFGQQDCVMSEHTLGRVGDRRQQRCDASDTDVNLG
jgi:hypothetical protein